MDSPTRLYLVRHGEVEERYHRVFGGRIDMQLSARGREQACALARYLAPISFTAIYASPMKRVQETLQDLLLNHGTQPVILPDLQEVDFGAWTGSSWDQIDTRFGVSAYEWLDQLERGLISQAEPVDHFRQRIERALEQILAGGPDRICAVVCHGGVIRMILSSLLRLPLKPMAAFNIDYASLTVIDWTPAKTEVQLLNFVPWRDQP